MTKRLFFLCVLGAMGKHLRRLAQILQATLQAIIHAHDAPEYYHLF